MFTGANKPKEKKMEEEKKEEPSTSLAPIKSMEMEILPGVTNQMGKELCVPNTKSIHEVLMKDFDDISPIALSNKNTFDKIRSTGTLNKYDSTLGRSIQTVEGKEKFKNDVTKIGKILGKKDKIDNILYITNDDILGENLTGYENYSKETTDNAGVTSNPILWQKWNDDAIVKLIRKGATVTWNGYTEVKEKKEERKEEEKKEGEEEKEGEKEKGEVIETEIDDGEKKEGELKENEFMTDDGRKMRYVKVTYSLEKDMEEIREEYYEKAAKMISREEIEKKVKEQLEKNDKYKELSDKEKEAELARQVKKHMEPLIEKKMMELKKEDSFVTELDDIERQVKNGTFSFHQVYIPEKVEVVEKMKQLSDEIDKESEKSIEHAKSQQANQKYIVEEEKSVEMEEEDRFGEETPNMKHTGLDSLYPMNDQGKYVDISILDEIPDTSIYLIGTGLLSLREKGVFDTGYQGVEVIEWVLQKVLGRKNYTFLIGTMTEIQIPKDIVLGEEKVRLGKDPKKSTKPDSILYRNGTVHLIRGIYIDRLGNYRVGQVSTYVQIGGNATKNATAQQLIKRKLVTSIFKIFKSLSKDDYETAKKQLPMVSYVFGTQEKNKLIEDRFNSLPQGTLLSQDQLNLMTEFIQLIMEGKIKQKDLNGENKLLPGKKALQLEMGDESIKRTSSEREEQEKVAKRTVGEQSKEKVIEME